MSRRLLMQLWFRLTLRRKSETVASQGPKGRMAWRIGWGGVQFTSERLDTWDYLIGSCEGLPNLWGSSRSVWMSRVANSGGSGANFFTPDCG